MIVTADTMSEHTQPKQVTEQSVSHDFSSACYYLREPMKMPRIFLVFAIILLSCVSLAAQSTQPQPAPSAHAIVLHVARLLDVESGHITTPGEILVSGDSIVEVGAKVARPSGAEIIDLGDTTLLPGLIDAHVHLFLHPGAEDLQTVQESVPQRTIMATLAARDDLMAGFTAERDMGTEGAGSADTAVRNAINQGQIPARAYASVAMPSTFSAATKTPSATTLSSTYFPMRRTPTTPPNSSPSSGNKSRKARTSSRFTKQVQTPS